MTSYQRVALSLLIIVAASPLTSQKTCPTQGDANNPLEQTLNRMKNRQVAPPKLNPKISLDAMLAVGLDKNRFVEKDAAQITGFVVKVKDGSVESCNCHSKTRRDTHIYVGKSPTAKLSECVIVEVTPFFRDVHPLWTTTVLKELTGKVIQFTGWMLYDYEHIDNARNSNPNGKTLWRATVWELHPVTGIATPKSRSSKSSLEAQLLASANP